MIQHNEIRKSEKLAELMSALKLDSGGQTSAKPVLSYVKTPTPGMETWPPTKRSKSGSPSKSESPSELPPPTASVIEDSEQNCTQDDGFKETANDDAVETKKTVAVADDIDGGSDCDGSKSESEVIQDYTDYTDDIHLGASMILIQRMD